MAVALILFVAVVWIVVQDASVSKKKSDTTTSTCNGVCGEEEDETNTYSGAASGTGVMARAAFSAKPKKHKQKKEPKSAPPPPAVVAGATEGAEKPVTTIEHRKKGIKNATTAGWHGVMDEPLPKIGVPGMMDTIQNFATCTNAPKQASPSMPSLLVFGAPPNLGTAYVHQPQSQVQMNAPFEE